MGKEVLEDRIVRLVFKERIAAHRDDWAAATRVVVEKAALKEILQRLAAPRR